jgi:hypothetical protein
MKMNKTKTRKNVHNRSASKSRHPEWLKFFKGKNTIKIKITLHSLKQNQFLLIIMQRIYPSVMGKIVKKKN